MLEIKCFYGDWKEATKEEAEAFYKVFCARSTAIKHENKRKYFNEKHIRGGHISICGNVETTEEQERRIFESYKNDLIKVSIDNTIRFNVIQYTCSFPKINSFIMAEELVKLGYEILYDDSSISIEENGKNERKVKRLLQEVP